MEFLGPNLLDTTTIMSITSGTFTVDNLFLRDPSLQYSSSGFDNDLTTSTIVIQLDSTLPVSRIGLDSINWKSFTIFTDGATASTLSISGGDTTVSDYSNNSNSSMFLTFTTVSTQTITIDVKSTQSADAEKAIGYLHVSDLLLSFERTPAAKNYKPKLKPKQVVHSLSNGTTRINKINETRMVDISFQNITTAFRDNLKSVYDRKTPFAFVGFPTTTGFDGFFFNCVWTGPFTGFEYSDDAAAAGHSIVIKLEEQS